MPDSWRGLSNQVSLDDDHGLYHCHVCGAGGDRVDWIMRVLNTDFRGALRWLGVVPETSQTSSPGSGRGAPRANPCRAKRWADTLGRELRLEHYVMERVVAFAEWRLRADPEDELAWNWLSWTANQERIAYMLDLVEGTEAEQLELYREMRSAA